MKNFNTLEMCIAFFITLVAGVIAGVSPGVAASVAFVYFFSCALASDIIGHVRSKKLPSLYEGLGVVCLFLTIVLSMIGLKRQNIAFNLAALAFIVIDCVLIYVQGRVDGKTSAEALEEVKDEVKD